MKERIRVILPSLIERGRMGDQNALAMLTAVHRKKETNERSKFAFEVASEFVRCNPKEWDGVVRIGADDSESLPQKAARWLTSYSPLSIALVLFPFNGKFDTNALPIEVRSYLESLIQFQNEDFSRFPTLAWEFGD